MTLKHTSLVGSVMALVSVLSTPRAATRNVSTILGTGVPGYSDTHPASVAS